VQLALEVFVVEPTLMVIGLNHRTAPLPMRERFWIGENRRYEVLRQLKSAEGIEEIVVLSTCCRTDFLVWAGEPTQAANSLQQFLRSEYGLKLTEWQHFYRLLDEAALTHMGAGTHRGVCRAIPECHRGEGSERFEEGAKRDGA
jgi:glutamyl-tRNA reductase